MSARTHRHAHPHTSLQGKAYGQLVKSSMRPKPQRPSPCCTGPAETGRPGSTHTRSQDPCS
eukprot:722881-Alexandrium_andersonii.AAC.1